MSLPSDYPIEGDGICENLFYFLWSKDDMEKGPMLHIPETVIFRMKQPIAWYFTSVNGQIKRKNRNNLTVTKIEEIFCRKKLSSDIVACFIETNPEQTGGAAVFNYYNMDAFLKWLQSDDKKDGILQQFIEPCDVIKCQWSPKMCLIERRQSLYPLTDNRYNIYERTVTYEGMPHNSKILPVKGSLLPSLLQQICNNIVNHITETSYNKYNISNFVAHFKVDSKDRLWFLYSTSIHLTGGNSNNSNIDNNNNSYLGSKTRNIQSATTFGSIYSPKPNSTMKKTKSTQQLFAQDQSQSQLRLNSQESQQSQMQKMQIPPQKSAVLTIPKTVNIKGSNPYYKAANLERSYQCPTCGDFVEESCVHPVLYKLIIKYHGVLTKQMNKIYGKVEYPISDEIKENVGKIGLFEIPRDKDDQPPENFDKIPPPIRFIHPKLSYSNYVKYCKDPLFLFKSVGICEECFLKYAEYSDGSMPKPEPSPSIYTDSQLSKEELKAIRERRLESLKDKSLWSPLFSNETNSNTQTKSKYAGPTTDFGKMASKRPSIPASNTEYITGNSYNYNNTHYQSSSSLNNNSNRYDNTNTASSYYSSSTAGTGTAKSGKRSCSLPSIPTTASGTATANKNKSNSRYVYKGGRVDSPMVFDEENDNESDDDDEEKQFEKYYSTYLEPPRQKQEKFYRDLYANPNLREGHPLTAVATEEVIRAQMTDGVLDPYQRPGEHLSPTEYGERRTEMLRQKLPKPLLAPQVLNDSEEKIIRKKEQRRERLEGKTGRTTTTNSSNSPNKKKKGNTRRSKSPIEDDKYLNVQHYLEMPNTPEPRPKKNKKSTKQQQETHESGDDGYDESGEYNEPYDQQYYERPESGVDNVDME